MPAFFKGTRLIRCIVTMKSPILVVLQYLTQVMTEIRHSPLQKRGKIRDESHGVVTNRKTATSRATSITTCSGECERPYIPTGGHIQYRKAM